MGELKVFVQRDYSSELTPCCRQAAITWHTDWWEVSRGAQRGLLAMNALANISLVLCRLVSILLLITADESPRSVQYYYRPNYTLHSEEAVEYGELETFLRLNETWDESIEETRPTLPTKPIGVPGASSPSQMAKPAHRALFNASPGGTSSPLQRGAAPASSPSSPASKDALRQRNESEFDVSDELSGYGLQGVKVTQDDLLALVEELGLGGEEADDLVKGLGDFSDKSDKGNGTAANGARKDDGGGNGPEQAAVESGAEAKPEAAAPAAQEEEEAKAVEGDGVGEAETLVVDAAST